MRAACGVRRAAARGRRVRRAWTARTPQAPRPSIREPRARARRVAVSRDARARAKSHVCAPAQYGARPRVCAPPCRRAIGRPRSAAPSRRSVTPRHLAAVAAPRGGHGGLGRVAARVCARRGPRARVVQRRARRAPRRRGAHAHVPRPSRAGVGRLSRAVPQEAGRAGLARRLQGPAQGVRERVFGLCRVDELPNKGAPPHPLLLHRRGGARGQGLLRVARGQPQAAPASVGSEGQALGLGGQRQRGRAPPQRGGRRVERARPRGALGTLRRGVRRLRARGPRALCEPSTFVTDEDDDDDPVYTVSVLDTVAAESARRHSGRAVRY